MLCNDECLNNVCGDSDISPLETTIDGAQAAPVTCVNADGQTSWFGYGCENCVVDAG